MNVILSPFALVIVFFLAKCLNVRVCDVCCKSLCESRVNENLSLEFMANISTKNRNECNVRLKVAHKLNFVLALPNLLALCLHSTKIVQRERERSLSSVLIFRVKKCYSLQLFGVLFFFFVSFCNCNIA